jgi:hypothetical protein
MLRSSADFVLFFIIYQLILTLNVMVPHALWYCIYVIRCLGTFMLRGMLIAVCNSTIVLDADLLLIKNSFSESVR